jgi:hypothetical protein
MPYAPHLRVSAIGTLGGDGPTGANAPERFSYSFAIGGRLNPPGTSIASRGALLEDVVNDVRAFHARSESSIGEDARIQEVKIAQIGPDGRYQDDPYISTGVTAGGAGRANLHPPQVALAVSLMTDRRGATGRGRFFLPMPQQPVQIPGLIIPGGNTDAIRDSLATLINNINNQPQFDTSDEVVVVASTKGYNTKVNAVRVGRAFDTVQSRRRSLEERYGAPAAVN